MWLIIIVKQLFGDQLEQCWKLALPFWFQQHLQVCIETQWFLCFCNVPIILSWLGAITLSQDDLGLQRIKPGEKYTYNGTLSLVKTALVVSKDGRMKATRDVWTGPTDGSNIEYKLSKDFEYSQNIKRHWRLCYHVWHPIKMLKFE